MEIVNRQARFNYFINEEIECGISLTGTEVKSIREGSANINDSYARVKNNEIYLIMKKPEKENFYYIKVKLKKFQGKLN